MSAIVTIRQGEDLEFAFDLDGEDITGWICLMEVKQFPTDSAFISRIIPPDEADQSWPGFLTPQETAALAVDGADPYYLIGKLTNSTLNQERQVTKRFGLNKTLKLPEQDFLDINDQGDLFVINEAGLFLEIR